MIKVSLAGKVLVVVDMEPDYKSCMCEAQLKAVEALLREAVKQKCLIVFLEFYGGGTMSRLLRCVRGYGLSIRVPKGAPDGSDEILAACGGKRHHKFVVCGVNTNCCVSHTVRNLSYKMEPTGSIEVFKEGCGAGSDGNRWDIFPKAFNIALV